MSVEVEFAVQVDTQQPHALDIRNRDVAIEERCALWLFASFAEHSGSCLPGVDHHVQLFAGGSHTVDGLLSAGDQLCHVLVPHDNGDVVGKGEQAVRSG